LSFSMMCCSDFSLGTDGESSLGGLLLGQSDGSLVLTLNGTGVLGDVELDVAVRGQIRRDTTVSTVGSSSTVDGSLDANVGDTALFGIKHLGLSVRLEVGEEVQHVLDGLLGEATVVMVDILTHGVSAGTTGVSTEGHDGSVLTDALHIGDGLEEVETAAGASGVVSVLVMRAEIVNSALGSRGGGDGLSGILDHCLPSRIHVPVGEY
jgi:hypothetical protein